MRMHVRSLALPLLSCLACGGSPAGDSGEASSGESSETSSAPTTGDATTSTSDPTSPSPTGEPGSTGTSGEPEDTGSTAADATTGDAGEDFIYPEPDWEPVDPMVAGFDPTGLEAMAAEANGTDSNCLVVTRRGQLVGEWYWNDYGPETRQDNVYSVTKSVTSALVGIAVERGELDIEAPAGFSEWVGTQSEAIKLRNLISNDSGREWSFNKDYIDMGLAADQTQFAVDLTQQKPIGAWWEYNNAAIQTVERALVAGTGSAVDSYAAAHLFNKIHMAATMGHDQDGNTLTYQGVSASCRDLARFGYLYLRGGLWAGGEQVVPAAWVTASTTPSTALNQAYGFMWWLNRDGHWILPSTPLRDEGDGRLVPDAPAEMFAAIGAGGQLVVVDPTSESVWVRLGPLDLTDAAGIAKLKALWAAFAAALT